MEPTLELIRQLRKEEISDSRRLSFEQKFLAGAELFDYASSITMAGIRFQHPEFSDQQILGELRRRLAFASRRESKI